MTADATSPSLNERAAEFADQLTDLTRGVLGQDSPRFHAINMGNRVRVTPIDEAGLAKRIPVTINGEEHLTLLVRYKCCWDGPQHFLATDKADIHLFYQGASEPLLRLEYVRSSKNPPGAHLQLHAHRDEMAYLLRLADAGQPKVKMARRRTPRLAEMHLPVGGHRMRPALEDILLFLHRELAIDVVDGWRVVLDRHLENWRRIQLRSAVRDAPEEAVKVLRALGYAVEPPKVGGPRPSLESVKLYWP